MKVIILKGLPGSGKTTEANKIVAASNGHTKRINKDDIRDMTDNGKWSKTNEHFIIAVRDTLIHAALEGGYDVIVDDTNFDPKHEKRIRQIASQYKADVEVQFIDTPLEECIKRDAVRPENRRCGEKVIRGMYDQYLKESRARKTIIEPLTYDWSLPYAIICDLDGTMALMNGRNPYDASTCETDKLNIPVKTVVDCVMKMTDCRLLFVSGREYKYMEQTVRWLEIQGLTSYKPSLFMRPTGDTRKDSIVKKEIYEREVKGKYNVLFVLDDRLQVCRMWYEQGLTVLRVGDPDADF